MKKTIVFILLISFFAGCKKHSTDALTGQTNIIDGLELTFIKSNLQKSFNTVYFLNENTGYLAGSDGSMYKTVDGANSWTALNTNTSLPLYDIYFLNSNEGFAVGGEANCSGTGCIPKGAVIIHTTDGGQTWSPLSVTTSEKIELKSICFPTNSLGFAVGYGSILTTKDGGVNWQETKINDLGGIMMDVKFLDKQKGLIACTFGKLLKTTDGGTNWNVSSPFPQIGANTLALVNDNLIFSAGYTNIEKSSDFGTTWSNLPGYPTDIFKLIFKSENTGYAFGRGQYSGGDFGRNYGAIYFTNDGGSTWKGSNQIQEIGMIESASFPTANVGYAISGNIVIKIKKQ